jgi:hypothetical protein
MTRTLREPFREEVVALGEPVECRGAHLEPADEAIPAGASKFEFAAADRLSGAPYRSCVGSRIERR